MEKYKWPASKPRRTSPHDHEIQNPDSEMDRNTPVVTCLSHDLGLSSQKALTDVNSGTQLDDRLGNLLESRRWLTQPTNCCKLAASNTQSLYNSKFPAEQHHYLCKLSNV